MFDLNPMKRLIAVVAVVAVVAGVFSAPAAANAGPGTNSVVLAPQGTNALTLVTQGTNAVVVVSQGTNSVTFVTQGTNAVVLIRQTTRPAAPPPKTNGWNSLVAAGLTLTRGNSDTVLFTAKALTQKKDEHNEWLLQADGAYGDNNSVNSADSLHGLAQNNHFFTPRFYSYANADALHDGIQALSYRVSLSPGAGYYFIKDKRTTLSAELGPGIITEDRGGEDETYMSLRMAEHWEQKVTPTAKLWEKAEILPQINHFDNYTADIEFGVDTAITKRVSLQVVLDDNYVNEPAPGRRNDDVKLVAGLAWKF
jgi:putative salt-induced outer membrane protein YdiY